MRFLVAALTAVILLVRPADAASRAELDELVGLIGVPEIVHIMAEEGDSYGEDLRDELLGGAAPAQWDVLIAALYAPEAMMEIFRSAFDALMVEAEAAPLIAFFRSDLGRRIITQELTARSAMIDEDIEEAAGEKLAEMRDDGDPRLALLDDYISVNDLIENNVVGALNSNYAFYSGLATGPDFADVLTEEQILADVWGQEEEIRLDTAEWIYAYLALAYRPLDDDELRAYIALSETPAGRALNRALFDAFDEMYVAISEGLGIGAAQILAGQDL